MAGYSIILPPPWQRVRLGAGIQEQVAELVDRAAAQVPKNVPPDQVGPLRRRLERQLTEQLEAAHDAGAVDYYFPASPMHGNDLNASFTVSAVIPDAMADASDVADIMAELLRTGGEPVEAGGSVWVRSDETVLSEPDDLVGQELAARKVEYVAASPDDHRRWVIVSFTTLGDGKPDSEFTHLVVELFDALMTTWRWDGREDLRAG